MFRRMPVTLCSSYERAARLAILIDIIPAQLAAENLRGFLEWIATPSRYLFLYCGGRVRFVPEENRSTNEKS